MQSFLSYKLEMTDTRLLHISQMNLFGEYIISQHNNYLHYLQDNESGRFSHLPYRITCSVSKIKTENMNKYEIKLDGST